MVLNAGPARRVSIYVGEDEEYHGNCLYAAVLDFLFYRGVAGATVTRGIAGFGADHQLHTTRILRLAENLPIKIEFVESAGKLDEILPQLYEMVGTGLIEVQDTTVLKAAQPPEKEEAAGAGALGRLKKQEKALLMRIYIRENDRWRDKPLYQAIVESLHANNLAGVTVYRGIAGFGADRRIRRENPLGLSHNRPIMLAAVDTEEKLRAYLPVLDDMIEQGLVVLSEVEVVKYMNRQETGPEDKESGT